MKRGVITGSISRRSLPGNAMTKKIAGLTAAIA
jgi:hypothetical protein